MPKIAGPWLAGCYDSDRSTSRAAQDALNLVFSDPKKVQGVRKTFQASILEYCKEAVISETVQTLSDMRAVSSDDAEATYARVVATALSVINSLLIELPDEDISVQSNDYESIIGDKKLWAFASHSDVLVRRATHRLVRTFVGKLLDVVHQSLQVASTVYVYKGLTSDQTGSATEYAQTLLVLTQTSPSIWTENYTGSKPAASRLRQWLKKGSQAGTADYWTVMTQLFRGIPVEVLPANYDDAAQLLSSAHQGVAKKEERFNASSAWVAYFTLVNLLSEQIPESDSERLLAESAMPVIKQYLFPSQDTNEWTVGGAKSAWIISKILIVSRILPLLEQQWPGLGEKLGEDVKTSLPEQSKDFEKSQTAVAAAGERWASLQRELFKSEQGVPETLQSKFVATCTSLLHDSVTVLQNREGKPFGAAATIEELVRTCGEWLLKDNDFKTAFVTLVQDDIPRLYGSRSQRHLLHSIYALKDEETFDLIFNSMLNEIATSEAGSNVNANAVKVLFTHATPKKAVRLARESTAFQSYIQGRATAEDDGGDMTMFANLLNIGAVSGETLDAVLSRIASSLSLAGKSTVALKSLDTLAKTNDVAVKAFASRTEGPGEQLLPSLLKLEQSADDNVAETATKISNQLSADAKDTSSTSRFKIVLQNLNQVTQSSLSMHSLFELANRLLGEDRHIEDSSQVLPSIETWRSALMDTINVPEPSLALLSPLGGALHLTKQTNFGEPPVVQHDGEGLSQALRIAMFISRLLTTTDLLEGLSAEQTKGILVLLYITTLMAEDTVSIPGAHELDTKGGAENEAEVLDFVSEVNRFIVGLSEKANPSAAGKSPAFSSIEDASTTLLEAARGTDPIAYYHAVAYAKLQANIFELHGHNSQLIKASEEALRTLRSQKDPLQICALLAGHQSPLSGSQTLDRFCNELIADLTDAKVSSDATKMTELLAQLNVILQAPDVDITDITATQRLVFLVKNLTPQLEGASTMALRAEVCKTLSLLIHGIQDMYGEHWSQLLDFLCKFWTSEHEPSNEAEHEERILLVNASLRLYCALNKLRKKEESNDDLVDSWKEHQDELAQGLMKLLKATSDVPDEAHQPLMVTNDRLARAVANAPISVDQDIDELYALLYKNSRPVQQAAFDLLHKQIPIRQEQISFDAALEKKTAQLPDELLSLILEAPTLDSLVDESFDRRMPLSLQGYLYSWRLLFDHFDSSSYKVKSDYIEQLKDGNYLSGLLNFTFDFLRHSQGRPIDASKFEITEYIPDMEPSPERDVQWLLTHLFYLAISNVPSLVKSYYLDIRSRQTSLSVESWTAKYISPLVIDASLKSVAEWSESSVKDDPEYEKMKISVGMRSKEVNVSYVVDEQTMAIKVILPESYPLDSAKVVGVARVAVKEEKWQSWLRNTQGVITFSVSPPLTQSK